MSHSHIRGRRGFLSLQQELIEEAIHKQNPKNKKLGEAAPDNQAAVLYKSWRFSYSPRRQAQPSLMRGAPSNRRSLTALRRKSSYSRNRLLNNVEGDPND